MDYRTMGHSRLGKLEKKHMGKRTLMVYDRGTCLLVEGLSLEIVDDSSWKSRKKSRRKSVKNIRSTVLKRDMNHISSNASYAGTTPWRHWRQE